MGRTKRNPHGLITVSILFFAAFFLLLNGLTLAGGEADHGGSHEGVHTSSPESADESGHGGAHEGDRRGDLLDLLYRFICFALLVIILFVVMRWLGLKDFLTARIEEIKQRLEDLQKEKEETEGRCREAERQLRDFEGERKDIIEQFRTEGKAEKERIIAEAKDRAAQIVEQAELTIQQEMQLAKDRVMQGVVALATQKAGEIMAKEMTDGDQDRLVNEFIERVGKSH